MKNAKQLLCIAGLVGLAGTATAQVFNIDEGDQSIPDGDANGVAFLGKVYETTPIDINKFKVILNIEGDDIAFNGDLYSILRAPTGQAAVLLNRPGVGTTGDVGLGYGDNGMSVRLYDGANDPNHKDASGNPLGFTDIHVYNEDPLYKNPEDQLSGIFKSDGRSFDPMSVYDTWGSATRDKTLSVFQGINPNGTWSLFIADMASTGNAKITSWGLDFTPIPEPQEYAMAIGAGLMAFAIYRRRSLKTA